MPKAQAKTGSLWTHRRWGALLAVACILGAVAVLFARSFLPNQIVFSNDGPLGFFNSAYKQVPSAFHGVWQDLNWLGGNDGFSVISISEVCRWMLGPIDYSKFYAAFTIFFLGVCAWVCFRQLKLHWLACLLGGLAAALNSDMLSAACWGVETQTVCFGLYYLALAALFLAPRRWAWLTWVVGCLLAGFAVGLSIFEGLDIGALFSIAFAALAFCLALTREAEPMGRRVVKGLGSVAIIAVFAFVVAMQGVAGLVQTQIKGIVGTQQDAATKAQHWDQATQFSLPKRELLGVVVPGLFGFRGESSQHGLEGGDYWGAAGRNPALDRYFESGNQGQAPGGPIRYSGGGVYAGVVVVLLAAWAAAQALRKQNSAFSPESRKLLWFLLGLMGVCVLLAFGRHAPFYQVFYALPYFSTIRNPAKFMHIFSWALVIVFAYGVDALSRRYLESAEAPKGPLAAHLRAWWSRASVFDRKWSLGCLAVLGVSVVGWVIYASSRSSVEGYLQTVGFGAEAAKAIAGFSLGQVGWYVLFLVLSVGALTLILSGWLSGRRSRWAAGLLGVLLLADLGLMDRPWVIHWDYTTKYATNPIIDQLRQAPYEHRVSIAPRWLPGVFGLPQQAAMADQYLQELYTIEWMQHQFKYYDVQSLDIVQMPRMPEEVAAFEGALQPRSGADVSRVVTRRWELTNTRYLLGLADDRYIEALNQGLDPGRNRFRIATRFDIVPRDPTRPSGPSDWAAVPSTNGGFALFEFTGALPRAKLYSHWQVSTNDPAAVAALLTSNASPAEVERELKAVGTNDFLALKELASPAFDPAQTVIVDAPAIKPPASPLNSQSATDAGTVQFVSYASKHIVLRANAKTPSVLLLNDKFDPSWQVWVDGKPQTLLRCNYVMRGVEVPPGEHQVEFRFVLPLTGRPFSLAGLVAGLLLLGFVLVSKPSQDGQEPPAPTTGTAPTKQYTKSTK